MYCLHALISNSNRNQIHRGLHLLQHQRFVKCAHPWDLLRIKMTFKTLQQDDRLCNCSNHNSFRAFMLPMVEILSKGTALQSFILWARIDHRFCKLIGAFYWLLRSHPAHNIQIQNLIDARRIPTLVIFRSKTSTIPWFLKVHLASQGLNQLCPWRSLLS